MNHRCSHGQFLLHAVREIGDQLLLLVGQLHKLEQFLGALRRRRAIETIHAPHKTQILLRSQPAKKRHPFRHHADLPLHICRVALQIFAENANVS